MRDTVLAALTAFLVEHQHCGELDGGRDRGAIWLECSCGARIAQPATISPPVHIEGPYVDERHSR
jgi:hypothetical protein